MSYVESNLVPGETVIYKTRLHWIVMLGHMVLGCLLLGLPGVLLLYYELRQSGIASNTVHIMESGGVALLVCGVAAILIGMVRRNATEMAVTNRRVVRKTGIGISVSLVPKERNALIANNIIADAKLGAVVGTEYGKIVTGDLTQGVDKRAAGIRVENNAVG